MNAPADSKRRGQPLAILGLILLSYAGMRINMWETPFAQVEALVESLPPLLAADESDPPGSPDPRMAVLDTAQYLPAVAQLAKAIWSGNGLAITQPPSLGLASQYAKADQRLMAGHNMLFMAGLAELPVTPALAAFLARDGRQNGQLSLPATDSEPDRWSMDGWLFFRQGSPSLASGGVRPASYGGSQAGAVLRYRLSPKSDHRPAAYARATRSLRGVAETELAAGFAARPISNLPLTAHIEVRGRSASGVSEVRPAAFVVTELPPAQLPLGVQAEAYLQAGYVGGDFATGFADGQIHASREVTRFRLGSLRAGAAAWGGAQRGAARLDIGPSASVDFKIGEVNSRAQLDYRMRVAGDAEPGDGVAFTLSAGF